MFLVLSRKKLEKVSRMKEYEEMGQTTQENGKQKEAGTSSSWASKFLGLPSKMGGWVIGKKANEEPINNDEIINQPLPLQDSASPPQPSSIVIASPYEISEDEDEHSFLDLSNDNENGGLADEMNMKYVINEHQEDTDNSGEDVNEENEDEQELKNRTTDQSDAASTDSFASASSPPEICNTESLTLVEIKQEPLDEDEVHEVDQNGVKVKVVKFPVLELAELFRCKEELEALKRTKTREEEKSVTLQPASQVAPLEPEATSSSSASASRRNPGRDAKKPNKKSVKTEKNVQTEKNKKTKLATTQTKQRNSKKMRAATSSATKEKKPNVDEFSCPECTRTFSSRSGLRNHELTHKKSTGRFKCKVCDKDQFKTAHHLRQHEACHFPTALCNYCEKKFGTPSNLANHQRTSKVCKAIRENRKGQ